MITQNYKILPGPNYELSILFNNIGSLTQFKTSLIGFSTGNEIEFIFCGSLTNNYQIEVWDNMYSRDSIMLIFTEPQGAKKLAQSLPTPTVFPFELPIYGQWESQLASSIRWLRNNGKTFPSTSFSGAPDETPEQTLILLSNLGINNLTQFTRSAI